jgi:hypothetical protein
MPTDELREIAKVALAFLAQGGSVIPLHVEHSNRLRAACDTLLGEYSPRLCAACHQDLVASPGEYELYGVGVIGEIRCFICGGRHTVILCPNPMCRSVALVASALGELPPHECQSCGESLLR